MTTPTPSEAAARELIDRLLEYFDQYKLATVAPLESEILAFGKQERERALEEIAMLVETHSPTQTKDGMRMLPVRMGGCESRRCLSQAIRALKGE